MKRFKLIHKLKVVFGILIQLRSRDFKSATSFMVYFYPEDNFLSRLVKFTLWSLNQIFNAIPKAMENTTFASDISSTSIWLADENPLEDFPWKQNSSSELPKSVEVVVIGAGFTGAGCAYHWSKLGKGKMVVLEMNQAASGASGRNEGVVVMGRYFSFVKTMIESNLIKTHASLNNKEIEQMASQFATAYVQSSYTNAEMIEKTIIDEGFDCDYSKNGWIQPYSEKNQDNLQHSINEGLEAGFDDWTKINPEEALSLSGIRISTDSGFSKGAATWHPAKWVWSLLGVAVKSDHVDLFTNTKVESVKDSGEYYVVNTTRGKVQARYIINATESYTALLHPSFTNKLYPKQTQGFFAKDGPTNMKERVAMGGTHGWFGRVPGTGGYIAGSDGKRVAHNKAGVIDPSRFITKFLVGHVHEYFGAAPSTVQSEWTCTAGFTDDEYPIVGTIDNKRQYIIAGMCGSGSGVHFNASKNIVCKIADIKNIDCYPEQYFSPNRILNPNTHKWPEIED